MSSKKLGGNNLGKKIFREGQKTFRGTNNFLGGCAKKRSSKNFGVSGKNISRGGKFKIRPGRQAP